MMPNMLLKTHANGDLCLSAAWQPTATERTRPSPRALRVSNRQSITVSRCAATTPHDSEDEASRTLLRKLTGLQNYHDIGVCRNPFLCQPANAQRRHENLHIILDL